MEISCQVLRTLRVWQSALLCTSHLGPFTRITSMIPGPSNVAVKSSAASKVMWGHLRFVRQEINGMTRFPHTPTNTSVIATISWTVLGTTNIFGWEKLRGSSAWRSFQSQAVWGWLWSTLMKEQKVVLVLGKIWLQKSVKNVKRWQKQKPHQL